MLKKIYSIAATSNFFPERAIFIIYYISIGMSATQVVLIQSIVSLTQFILEIPTGRFSDKIGRKTTMIIELHPIK